MGIGVELQLVQASRGPEQQPTVVAHALQNTESEKKVLSAGEMGYRASQKKIMIKFLEENKRSNIISNSNSNADILFIADDDVMFHRRFTSLYTNLDAYCFDGLASGGVLKLESSIWHAGTFPKLTGRYVGGWNLIDYAIAKLDKASEVNTGRPSERHLGSHP